MSSVKKKDLLFCGGTDKTKCASIPELKSQTRPFNSQHLLDLHAVQIKVLGWISKN